MKILGIEVPSSTVTAIGLGLVGLAQMVLTNKQQTNERNAMKAEIIEELMKKQS